MFQNPKQNYFTFIAGTIAGLALAYLFTDFKKRQIKTYSSEDLMNGMVKDKEMISNDWKSVYGDLSKSNDRLKNEHKIA